MKPVPNYLRTGAILLAALTLAACASPQESATVAQQAPEGRCDEATIAFSTAFLGLKDGRRATPICISDVGPGLDSADLAAEFSSVVAGNVRNAERLSGTDLDLLGVLVGTLKSGSGEDFVAGLLSRLGPDAAHGTVRIADRTMQFIDLRPGGPRGFAYGKGRKVVVAYARSPLGPPSHPLMSQELTAAIADILPLNTVGTDPTTASPAGDSIDDWPLARGNFSSPTDPGWVYFRTGPGNPRIHCGISPDGSMVGCDFERTPPFGVPEGTNQMVLDSSGLRYVQSDTPAFTRPDVDIAWIGERIVNGPASCNVTDRDPLYCRIVADGTAVRRTFG